MKINIFSFFFVFFFTCLLQPTIIPQKKSDTEKVLRTIADGILKDAKFNFVNTKTGKHFKSTYKAPDSTILQLASRYNDWRYWNGIINLALLKLGEELNEPAYSQFPLKNIAFAFDNYKYFEEKHNDEDKWGYPFGQLFIMNELDDCGAIGASIIEVYKSDSQERYKEYIDKAADHILNKQSRLEDGTLVRAFPHKWTLWADDLYKGLSFLSRMGVLTGDKKYFDFAAKQVINYHKYLFDEDKEIMYHNWYSDINQKGLAFWEEQTAGHY